MQKRCQPPSGVGKNSFLVSTCLELMCCHKVVLNCLLVAWLMQRSLTVNIGKELSCVTQTATSVCFVKNKLNE